MKQHGGVWLPDGEIHMADWLTKMNQWEDGALSYQKAKRDAALAYVKNWRVAVEVGGHVGTWARILAKHFEQVIVFEPVAEHRRCFTCNVLPGYWDAAAGIARYAGHEVELLPYAAGEAPGTVRMKTDPTSSGDTYPDPAFGTGDVEVVRIDDMLGEADQVDFCKLDAEGFELFALRGAEQMLRRCKPVICCEQKKGHGGKYSISDTAGVDFLKSLGYRVRQELSGDYLLTAE